MGCDVEWIYCSLYLGLKHFEFAAAPGSAEQLTPVSGRHPSVLRDPLLHVPIDVQVVEAVVPLTLFLSKTLS